MSSRCSILWEFALSQGSALLERAWPERVLRVGHEEGGICHAVLLQDDAGVRAEMACCASKLSDLGIWTDGRGGRMSVPFDIKLPEPLFYTVAEVAALLKRSEKTVERLCKQGLLRRDPTLSRGLILKAEVEHFVKGIASR